MRPPTPLLVLVALFPFASSRADWPPPGRAVRVDVTRDTWVSNVGDEANKNLGGATQLKTKGTQEMALIDIDPAPLVGHVITGATLHLHASSKDVQRRLTVSSLASEWVEGTSPTYQKQEGSASFNWAAQDRTPWAFPGSDLTAAMCGEGGTLWRFAEATPPDADAWQTVAVEPAVVAARVAGLSRGFVIFDDVGSEYERHGDQFVYHQFPNRFFHSRDQRKSVAPYLTVYVGGEDRRPPEAPSPVAADAAGLPPGEAVVTFQTPADAGPQGSASGTIGFFARYAQGPDFNWESAAPVPQYLVPRAGEAGGRVAMRLRDLNLKAGAAVTLGVRAVDGAGNLSPPATARFNVSALPGTIELKPAPSEPFDRAAANPSAGGVRVAVIDALDKASPVTGALVPARPEAYLQANHLWSAATKTVRLFAAKNEFVDFQILLGGKSDKVNVELTFDAPNGAAAPRAELYRFRHVATKLGPMPDPLVPLGGPLSIPAAGETVAGQTCAGLIADVYVPHDAAPGPHAGTLKVTSGGETVALRVELRVWDFTLPDRLSFLPEMNCYGLPRETELAYYRLAQAHRTCLNRLGYNWRGEPADGCVPEKDGDHFDWGKYDQRFGPLLDGSAFKDLPRGAVPVESFYLNLNENWPLDVNKAFKGGYWADEAFDETYRRAFARACGQFASHFRDKRWTGTFFELYLNNKVYYKKDSWGKCSAPWILDEPVNTQDFWALRYFGRAFHEGVAAALSESAGAASPRIKMAFRCDISRPQWRRDLLDGLLDVNVVGGAFRQYQRQVMDHKALGGEVVINYGSSNDVEDSNVQPVGWCLDTWCLGGDGVLPWQTVGNEKSWTTGDPLCLFYPPTIPGQKEPGAGPFASVRLKAYRRGQQDVEYLTLLGQATGAPRFAVASAVKSLLKLSAKVDQKNAEDAGLVGYGGLDPAALWDLRVRVGAMLDAAKPPARAQLVELRAPPRDPSKLPDVGYVTVAPKK